MNKRLIKWLLVVVWLVVIFMFSSQVGNVSEQNNRFFIKVLQAVGLDLDKSLGSWSNFIVRKAAHCTEYFILYMLVYNALIDDTTIRKAYALALLVVFLYACTDEYHQSFVPGRGPSFRDVLVDSSGGLLALIVLLIRSAGFQRRRSRR